MSSLIPELSEKVSSLEMSLVEIYIRRVIIIAHLLRDRFLPTIFNIESLNTTAVVLSLVSRSILNSDTLIFWP